MSRHRSCRPPALAALLLLGLATSPGCAVDFAEVPPLLQDGECHKDSDCLGIRSCVEGECVLIGDADGDGWEGDEDCDDFNPDVHPESPELCGDRVDQDCDGSLICDGGGEDLDGDARASEASGGTDCDDERAEI